MQRSRFLPGLLTFFFLTISASANPHRLDTISYNFALADGGGGSSAILDLSMNIEIFCVDFANTIFVPHSMYSANLSTITSGSNLSLTRFGGNASWKTVTIADDGVDGQSNDAADSAIINAAGALARYQMAAYLVSKYNIGGGNNAFNNGIQTAIWKILNPSSYALAPVTADSSEALESAAEWFNSTSTLDRDAYLANYRIVSDSTMTSCNGPGMPLCLGFQEQITVVPEPRNVAWLLMGLLGVCAVAFRRFRTTAAE